MFLFSFPNFADDASLCCLRSKKYQYVEGCHGRTLRFFARHSLRHVAPVRVSMYQNLSAIVASSIGFQNLP